MRFAVVFLVACASQAKSPESPMPPPPSQCAQLAEHVIGLMTASKHAAPEEVEPFKQVLVRRCTEDKWSADAQKCLLATSSLEQSDDCKNLLSEQQQDSLMKDGQAASHRLHPGDADGEQNEPKDSAAPPPPHSPTRGPRKAGDPCEGGQ